MKTSEYPPREWLKSKTSLADAEKAMRNEMEKLGVPISPKWLPQWEQFKAQLQPTDELWYYERFPEPLTRCGIGSGTRAWRRSLLTAGAYSWARLSLEGRSWTRTVSSKAPSTWCE